jgi:hypothetical protein
MTSPSLGARATGLIVRLLRNLQWGLVLGTLVGGGFCLIGVALFVVRGPRFLDPFGIAFGTVMLLYLAGGAGIGIIVGFARPLTRWRLGAIVVGIVGGVLAYGAAGVAMYGWIAMLRRDSWIPVLIIGVGAGGFLGNALWERYVEPTLPSRKPPPGPPQPRPPLGLWRP